MNPNPRKNLIPAKPVIITELQRSCGKVMCSQVYVILSTIEGGLVPSHNTPRTVPSGSYPSGSYPLGTYPSGAISTRTIPPETINPWDHNPQGPYPLGLYTPGTKIWDPRLYYPPTAQNISPMTIPTRTTKVGCTHPTGMLSCWFDCFGQM